MYIVGFIYYREMNRYGPETYPSFQFAAMLQVVSE